MKVRINTHGNPMPESHGEWVDLYTAEDTVLEPLDFKIISLGVAMELPAGYYAQVVPQKLDLQELRRHHGEQRGHHRA